MIEAPQTPGEVGGILAGLAGVLVLIQRVWRAFRSERVGTHRDNAEINILAELRQQNRELREAANRAYAERNQSMEELGSLRAQVEALERTIADLRRHIEALERRVHKGV